MAIESENKIRGCYYALLFANWNFHKPSMTHSRTFLILIFLQMADCYAVLHPRRSPQQVKPRSCSHCLSKFPVKLPATRSNIDLRLWSTRYNQMNCVLKADSLDSKLLWLWCHLFVHLSQAGKWWCSVRFETRRSIHVIWLNTDFKVKFAWNNI